VAFACFTLFGVVFTFAAIYPINTVLFEQAGGAHSAEEIRGMARDRIVRDQLRFGVGLVGYAAVLWAFRLPIPSR
jgi:hypothetical protein